MALHTPLLIIGAGPYGLSVAAFAKGQNLDCIVLGEPMGFWKKNMPYNMYLRSGCDWHYDPYNQATIEQYLIEQQQHPDDVEPISLDWYLGYVEWFQRQKGISPLSLKVQQLDYNDTEAVYQAQLSDGSTLVADRVVLALGFKYFKNTPEPYTSIFPSEYFSHTCDCVKLSQFEGKRVLLVGGRQSAFEWAALLHEAGAEAIHLSYRHATPAFAAADWSWVNPIVDGIAEDPNWFRRMSADEQQSVSRRLWAEGRLKLEPWLVSRIDNPHTHLHPESYPVATEKMPNGLGVHLKNGKTIEVDHIILATGYKVNVENIPFLKTGNILPNLDTHNGFPVLDEHLQSNLSGLYFTSMCATQDFGPFFAFTVAVRTSAKLIGHCLI